MIDSCIRLNLDVQENGMTQTVETKLGDTGRVLLITLSDGGVPYSVSDDCYCVFTGRKEDETVLYSPCTVRNNVIEYRFTEQTCAAAGTVQAEIRLYGSGGKLLTSAAFVLEVHDTVWHGEDAVSTDRMDALDSLVLELTDLKKDLEEGALTGPQGEKGDQGDPGEKGDKGDPGEKGPPGEDGRTPVKGEDYFTPEDKAELVEDVLAQLPEDGTLENLPVFNLKELGVPPVPLRGGCFSYDCDMTELRELLSKGSVIVILDIESQKGEVFTDKALATADWLSDGDYYQINVIRSHFRIGTGEVMYHYMATCNVYDDRITMDVGSLWREQVLYTPQNLTEEQKAQVRENIGIAGTGVDGEDGISVTHSWNGTVLTVASASGTSSADLKGEKGEQGVPGADGKTPVKGTDYFTQTDKEEMVNAVLAALPVGEEAVF